MRKAITINIPKPCDEDWNKMTPKEQGRHCSACNKTVIDFTSKTDEQVIKAFEKERNLCGRFKAQQLNREMVLARKDKNNYLSWVASGLFAFMALGQQDIHAQGEPRIVIVDSVKTQRVKGKIASSILNERVVVGKVTTANDNLALPGVSVIIKGTTKEVKTDFDGFYSIKVKTGDILVFSYVGMMNEEIIITKNSNNDVGLELSVYMDEVVMGYPSKSYMAFLKRKAKRKAKLRAIKNGERKRTAFGKFFFNIKSLFSKK